MKRLPKKKKMKVMNRVIVTLFTLIAYTSQVVGQAQDSTHVNKKRLTTFIVASGAAYSLTLVGLNSLWYGNSEREAFHFFNDNGEW